MKSSLDFRPASTTSVTRSLECKVQASLTTFPGVRTANATLAKPLRPMANRNLELAKSFQANGNAKVPALVATGTFKRGGVEALVFRGLIVWMARAHVHVHRHGLGDT